MLFLAKKTDVAAFLCKDGLRLKWVHLISDRNGESPAKTIFSQLCMYMGTVECHHHTVTADCVLSRWCASSVLLDHGYCCHLLSSSVMSQCVMLDGCWQCVLWLTSGWYCCPSISQYSPSPPSIIPSLLSSPLLSLLMFGLYLPQCVGTSANNK